MRPQSWKIAIVCKIRYLKKNSTKIGLHSTLFHWCEKETPVWPVHMSSAVYVCTEAVITVLIGDDEYKGEE